MKTVKNMNKAEKENKLLEDSELQEIEEDKDKKNEIEKFLELFEG